MYGFCDNYVEMKRCCASLVLHRMNCTKEDFLTLKSGRTLGYAEFGDPLGIATLHFHGWPFSRQHAWSMDAAAKRQGIRLICPDRPGLGSSDFQPGRDLADWPPVVEELADHLGWRKFHIVGISGGGPYALACAGSIAHRINSCHVVGGAPPIHDFGATDFFWVYRLLIKLRKLSPIALSMALLLGADLATKPMQHFAVRNLIGMLSSQDREVLQDPAHYQSMACSLRQAMQNGTAPVIADADLYLKPWPFQLQQITAPVDFWHGQQDRNIPWTYAAKLAARLPQAQTHWFPKEGHYSLPINEADRLFEHIQRTDHRLSLGRRVVG